MTRGATPDVAVVTVTYNGADLVLDCLAGLERQQLDGLVMEVVVVDNASSDGTAGVAGTVATEGIGMLTPSLSQTPKRGVVTAPQPGDRTPIGCDSCSDHG